MQRIKNMEEKLKGKAFLDKWASMTDEEKKAERERMSRKSLEKSSFNWEKHSKLRPELKEKSLFEMTHEEEEEFWKTCGFKEAIEEEHFSKGYPVVRGGNTPEESTRHTYDDKSQAVQYKNGKRVFINPDGIRFPISPDAPLVIPKALIQKFLGDKNNEGR